MNDPIISTSLLILWTLASGTWLCNMTSKKVAFWGSGIVALILGLVFTSGAYHIRSAYLNPFSTPDILLIIGLVWAIYLALPTVILVKLLSDKPRMFTERLRFSVAAAFLQLLFCVAPSIPLLILLSLE